MQTGDEYRLWFIFQKTKYVYDGTEKKQFQPLTFPIDHSIHYYMDWKGYQDDTEVAAAEKKFGLNKWDLLCSWLLYWIMFIADMIIGENKCFNFISLFFPQGKFVWWELSDIAVFLKGVKK